MASPLQTGNQSILEGVNVARERGDPPRWFLLALLAGMMIGGMLLAMMFAG